MGNYFSNEKLVHMFTSHAPDTFARAQHEEVGRTFREMAIYLNDIIPESADKTIMIRHLEDASFRANAAIARDITGTE